MLVRRGERDSKTELVKRQLSDFGFSVRATERLFDEHTRRNDNLTMKRQWSEPVLALGGFDGNTSRRALEKAGFHYIVDAGLGVGRFEYLGISLYMFPSNRTAEGTFPEPVAADDVPDALASPAYDAAAQRAVDSGTASNLEEATCGLIEVAGKAAGAVFVGTVAAALVVSELLRISHGRAVRVGQHQPAQP